MSDEIIRAYTFYLANQNIIHIFPIHEIWRSIFYVFFYKVFPPNIISLSMQYINPTGLGEVQLMKLFTNDEEAFTHALHWGLLSDGTECELCGQAKFEIIPDASAKYGIRVYCPFCNVKRSILHNTVFMHSKLPICTILHLLFCWSQRQMPGLVAFNLGIAETTVTNFFKTFRDACVKYYRFRSRKMEEQAFMYKSMKPNLLKGRQMSEGCHHRMYGYLVEFVMKLMKFLQKLFPIGPLQHYSELYKSMSTILQQ